MLWLENPKKLSALGRLRLPTDPNALKHKQRGQSTKKCNRFMM
jgi:hypothetical protein